MARPASADEREGSLRGTPENALVDDLAAGYAERMFGHSNNELLRLQDYTPPVGSPDWVDPYGPLCMFLHSLPCWTALSALVATPALAVGLLAPPVAVGVCAVWATAATTVSLGSDGPLSRYWAACDAHGLPRNEDTFRQYNALEGSLRTDPLAGGPVSNLLDEASTNFRYCAKCNPSIACLQNLTHDDVEKATHDKPHYWWYVNVPLECEKCSLSRGAVRTTTMRWVLTHHEGAYVSQLMRTKHATQKRNALLSYLNFLEDSGTANMTERKRVLSLMGAYAVVDMQRARKRREIRWRVVGWRAPVRVWAHPLLRVLVRPVDRPAVTRVPHGEFMTWASEIIPVERLRAPLPDEISTPSTLLSPRESDVPLTGITRRNSEDDSDAPHGGLDLTPRSPAALDPHLASPPVEPFNEDVSGLDLSERRLRHSHEGIPDDGQPYWHSHVCIYCKREYMHRHARKPFEVSINNYLHWCRKCDRTVVWPGPPPSSPDSVAQSGPSYPHTKIASPISLAEALCRETGHVASREVTSLDHQGMAPLGRTEPFVPMRETERMSRAKIAGPQIENVVSNEEETGMKVGPLVGNPTLYASKPALNRADAAKNRMLTPPDITYDPSPEMRQRRKRYVQYLKRKIFTADAIQEAVGEMGEFREFASKKLSPDNVDRFVEIVLGADYRAPERTAMVKREVTAKPEKHPRIVQDEGHERLVINAMAVSVYEHIFYAERNFKHTSIKGVPRSVAIEEVCEMFRDPFPEGSVAIECDQTKYEYHQTLNAKGEGLLDWEHQILTHIYKRLSSCVNATGVRFKTLMNEFYKPVRLKSKRKKHAERDPNFWTIAIDHMVRSSGGRSTSSWNGGNEMGNTLACIFKYPDAVMEDMRGKRFGQLSELHETVFEVGKNGKGRKARARFKVEGDDLVGKVSRWLAAHQAEIEANYRSLGLEAKLKFVYGTDQHPARAEFVGEHFCLVAGSMPTRHHHCPDLARNMICSGVSATNRQEHAVAAAACMSKAVSFSRSLPSVATYFANLAEDHVEQAGARTIEYDAPECLHRYGEKSVSLGKLRDMYDEGMENCLAHNERLLMSTSLEAEVSAEEHAKWAGFVGTVRWDTDANDVVSCMPRALAKRCWASYGENSAAN